MPIYEYRCDEGHIYERLLPVDRYLEATYCNRCGCIGQKVILHPPRVFGDYEGYESPATGKWIEGRRARERDFAESGCRPYEAGEREEMVKRQEANDRHLDKVVESVVETTLQEITS